MRYVITGASGHIGNNLVRMINKIHPEAEVVALTRRNIGFELEGANCTQSIGDLNDIEFLKSNILEGDRVVHCAALIDLTNKKWDEMYRVNYLLTKNICDICRGVGVDKFVYVGSVDAIFNSGEGEICEPEDYFPDKISDGYGKTKALACKYVLDTIKNHPKFNAGIILPTAVLGINDFRPSEAGKIIRGTLNGKAQFGIKGGYNFVDVLDVCRGILALLCSESRGQYIISGENVSVKELYLAIDEYKGLKKRPIILPTVIAIAAIPFVKTLTKMMIEVLQTERNYNGKRAQAELGITPTAFIDTLRATVDWHEGRIESAT